MFFIFLIFLTALCMEGIGSYISVVGLNSIFAGDWIIIAMAVILDVAKIVSVSFLYQSWQDIKLAMKSYLVVAVLTLMLITSVGAFGYLSGAFQKAIQPNREVAMQLEIVSTEKTQLDEEKKDLAARKKSIEAQIAGLPADFVSGRARLINSFKEDSRNIQTRLNDVDQRLLLVNKKALELKSANLDHETHVGPITFVSKAFGVSMEDAVKWVILTIIFVFDPLAIMLVLAGNLLLKNRKAAKNFFAPTAPVEVPIETPPIIETPSSAVITEPAHELEEVLEKSQPETNLKTIEKYLERIVDEEHAVETPVEVPAAEVVIEEKAPPPPEEPAEIPAHLRVLDKVRYDPSLISHDVDWHDRPRDSLRSTYLK